MRDIFLDADTGIDDALAHMVIAGEPELHIVGAGSCWGSLDSLQTAKNIKAVLRACGRGDVPVAIGARGPLRREFTAFHGIMGRDGLGDTSLGRDVGKSDLISSRSAAESIVMAAREHTGTLEILVTGPLTNVALALAIAPEVSRKIRRIVAMGGAFGAPGNVTPVAEANFWGDPEAAKMVLSSDLPLILVGLDVTSSTLVTAEDFQCWSSAGSLGQLATRMSRTYLEFYAQRLGVRAAPFHDVVAAAVLLDPSIAEYESRDVTVSCHDDEVRGFCIVDRRAWVPGSAPVTIATSVDGPRVVSRLQNALALPFFAGRGGASSNPAST